ncbi:MAG TPA: 1,6-anhydro-N-acetylmuramyl-L-alanine amidase AmpD [Rhodocyclaceae bacterium]|nr:1,6-anhydro-N-acetylmuramyl-L-alanine amidase AmpD [Rhodocyclaceae bacterium]
MTAWRSGGWLAAARAVPSPNEEARPAGSKISLVVIHYISLPPDQFGGNWVEQFFLNRLDPGAHPSFASLAGIKVSSHFYVRRNGEIVQFVDCDRRAWHAGQSAWQGRGNCNDYSVGIELEGCDSKPFEAAQYESLWRLLEALRERYPISGVAGHCHIAPGRKIDPGRHFNWSLVRERYPDLVLPPAEQPL